MNARLPAALSTADEHPVPDRVGANAYTDDPEFASLLPLYLPPELVTHLQPHLHRLGVLAGGELDRLAHSADLNPPKLEHRTRSGLDAQRIVKHPAYVEMERIAFGEFALAAISHRDDVLGWRLAPLRSRLPLLSDDPASHLDCQRLPLLRTTLRPASLAPRRQSPGARRPS